MMYYEYWGMTKPPFDNVPDPTMYVDCHVSMESAIAETLFAIEEGNECVAVIVGDVGLGKTLSLRIILDSLDQEKYRIALITNPDMTFIELLREIIGQLQGTQCEERRRIHLLETFNKLLFETIDEGKKVLIFVDEANAMSPANLESLRLLTNMQDDRINLFTIVLAGQLELARRLEHPRHANLLQRIGIFSRIDKIESAEILKSYVETRIKLSGGARMMFTDDAYDSLWEYSEQGVPRLINKICKLSIKAGETNQFDVINGEVVRQIGERFQNLTGRAVQKRKPRKRSESKVFAEPVYKKPEAAPDESGVAPLEVFQERRIVEGSFPERMVEQELPEKDTTGQTEAPDKNEPGTLTAAVETAIPESPEPAVPATEEPSFVKVNELDIPEEPEHLSAHVVEPVAPKVEEQPSEQAAEPVAQASAEPATALAEEPFAPAVEEQPPETMPFTRELEINGFKIVIDIPDHIAGQAKAASPEQRAKIAGVLAAQVLKNYPEMIASQSADPITVWSDVRKAVMGEIQ
jgi:general secretion pathway protein A